MTNIANPHQPIDPTGKTEDEIAAQLAQDEADYWTELPEHIAAHRELLDRYRSRPTDGLTIQQWELWSKLTRNIQRELEQMEADLVERDAES